MAYAIVSFVKDQLSNIAKDQLLNFAKDQYQGLRSAFLGVENEIKNLSSKLELISVLLNDAEKRSFQEKGLNLWLQQLKNFSYDAEDVLDEWITRTRIQEIERFHSEDAPPESRRKVSVSTYFPIFKNRSVNRDIAQKIKELDSRLDQIMKEKDQFNLLATTHTSVPEPRRVTTAFDVDESEILGPKIAARSVINNLTENAGGEATSNNNGPLVISIVGQGGIGKTTIAQQVYNNRSIKAHFELRIWICVSQPFDQINIAKSIIIQSSKADSPPNLSDLQHLLDKIISILSNKRFLLVLDDVWTEEDADWNPFKNALKAGLTGSRILVTTRNHKVARMMETVYSHQVALMSSTDSWLLLCKIAFSGRSEEDCRELKDIGKKIAEKCKGLPLAVKTMGGLLRYKDSKLEWQNVLDSKIWKLEEVGKDLFPHLYLSYDDLTPTMKRCLLYCAVFPKDYEMEAETLIRMWMAQGYLTTTNGSDQNEMELKGLETFGNLAMRCFFQDLEKDDTNSKIISCKMHDIVHDFVQFLTKNECYSTDRLEDKIKLENLRHLSLESTEMSINLASIHGIGKVRSFIAKVFFTKEISPKLFNGLKSVRVLQLHSYLLEDLPKEIGNLLHLRYIDLSNCSHVKELPDAICSLYNLQTLDLQGCTYLSRLPERIGNLINLRHLKLRGCNKLEMLPQGITKLTQLRTLGSFVVGKKGCELGGLEKLNQLQGGLEIVFRSPLNNVEEAEKAGLRNKEHLNELALEFDRDIEVSIDVMEALKPPLKLQSLGINGYRGTQLPSWIRRSLDNLRSLDIWGCSNCTSLPPLGKLPSLETLSICNMESLKRVGSEFLGVPEVAVAFPKLKELEFRFCLEWEEWDGLREATNVMPCLTQLSLWNCSKLKSMPPLGKLPSLESLNIENMNSVKRVGSEFLGVPEVAVAFPKLKKLVFSDCEEWEEWDGLREATNVMPCLTHLTLRGCSKLKTMPDHILGKMSPLRYLEIDRCPNLKVDKSKLSHIPHVDITD